MIKNKDLVDLNGIEITRGQRLRVIERKIDSLISPGVYTVRHDTNGRLILLPGVSVEELPSSIVEVVQEPKKEK